MATSTIRFAALAAILLVAGCARTGAPAAAPAAASSSAGGAACCTDAVLRRGLDIARRYRVAAIDQRRFTHDQLWSAMAPALRSDALAVKGIGQSMNGRALRTVTFGSGPTTVLLWSQMHGDESTATMAVADILNFFASATDDPLRERIRRSLTVVFLPMLNPDGAQLFQRENAAGIDINRDARVLATPEARALKGVHDALQPQFGFNLHDQNARTRVGPQGTQAAIALLAPAPGPGKPDTEGWRRARLVASGLAELIQREIPGRVAKYDDTFNPRAFGDLMEQWGTSTVLIESGALPDDPEKQRLRAINVAAILGALDAIGSGSYASADVHQYEALPYNTGGASDLLILGGQLVLPGMPPLRADLAVNYTESVARQHPRIRDVGDLQDMVAMDTIDATGLFIHPAPEAITSEGGSRWLRQGAPARLTIRRGPDPSSAAVRTLGDDR